MIPAAIFVVLFFYALPGKKENKKWNESRQFERYLEEIEPNIMSRIWDTHVSEQGLTVNVGMGVFHRNAFEEDAFYKRISAHWKSSEFVIKKKYSGKVQFKRFDTLLKTID